MRAKGANLSVGLGLRVLGIDFHGLSVAVVFDLFLGYKFKAHTNLDVSLQNLTIRA